jgi:starch synthase (maltosyl-transferring)
MKATFCITELDVGGAEKALVRIVTGLAQMGWDIDVVSLRDLGPLAQDLETHRIPVKALGCGGILDLRAIVRLYRHLRQRKPSIVVGFLHQANLVSRIAARFAGVGRVVSGIRVADRRRVVIWPDAFTKRLVDHYVAVSQSVADCHAALCGIDSSRISAITNGVDPWPESAFGLRSAAADSGPRHSILFVGRLVEQKAPLDLIDAFCRLPESLQRVTEVHLLGDGPLRPALEAKIRQKGLSESVRLHGRVDDVHEFLRRTDLFVLPSRWEGLPNALLEAMAAGVTVVATAVDGVQEIIEDGVTGWLVPADNSERLALAIEQALNSAEDRMRLADNAQHIVSERFTWGQTVTQFDQLLRRLIARPV